MHHQPNMKVLNKDQLQMAEEVLSKHLPKSVRVYGPLYAANRNVATTLEVIVDAWPDFKVIVCRCPPEYEGGQVFLRVVSYYSTDDQVLRTMLMEGNGFDWSTNFVIAGFDFCQIQIVKEVSSVRALNSRCLGQTHSLHLPDNSPLVTPAVDRDLKIRILSLRLSHVDLVKQTWKFGGYEKSHEYIHFLISNYPSCGVFDAQDQLLSWILLYDWFCVGVLYTLPEHRRKGYGKAVVSAMAKRLHAEGHPVFTSIEEENVASLALFKGLGFIEDPSYRAAWFEFNF